MMRRPERGLAALWVGVVVAVGGLTWVVVDGVGRDVGYVTNASVYAAPSASPPGTGPSGAASSVATASPTATPSTTGESEGATDGEDGVIAAGPPDPQTGGVAPPTATPLGPTAPAPAGPAVVTRSFTSPGGAVTASCSGSTLTLDGITPRDGFKVEDEFDEGNLKVKFESARTEVHLEVTCRSGTPTLVSD